MKLYTHRETPYILSPHPSIEASDDKVDVTFDDADERLHKKKRGKAGRRSSGGNVTALEELERICNELRRARLGWRREEVRVDVLVA